MRIRVTNVSKGLVLARRVWVARGWWDHLRGLNGRPKLMDGDALVLEPCRITHTLGLGYAIIAVYLDNKGQVITAPLLSGGKLGPYVPQAYMGIELPASRAGMVGPADLIEIGIEGPNPARTSFHRGHPPRRQRWTFSRIGHKPAVASRQGDPGVSQHA